MLASGAPEQRLFVIDDDELMCDLLSTLLEAHGYTVSAFHSGKTALTALASGATPAAVLTDLQMPGLEGARLVHRLRTAMPAGTVLIGMSASAAPAETNTALDAFLLKPFEVGLFEQTLEGLRQNAEPPFARVAEESSELSSASAAAPSLQQPALDPAIVAALGKTLNPGQVRELYDLTLNDVGKRYARIADAAGEGDLATVHREAHAVKGACGMVGARELQFLATQLEVGTTVETSVLSLFPAACERLRRMLDQKF